jgi:signal transduction protein with GAF and PtsI domain
MKKTEPQMCRVCGDLAKSPDLVATLEILAKNITIIMGVKGCTIRHLDEKKQTLEIVAAYGLSKAYLKKGPVSIAQSPVDRKVLQGKVISTRDILKENHVLYIDQAKKEGIRSVLSVPLMTTTRPIGVIRLYTDTPHDFTPEETEKCRAVASLGGILADKARIESEMQTLMRISQSVSSTLSLEEVLRMIVEHAATTLGMKAASLRLLDEDRETLKVKAAYGLSRTYLEKEPVEVKKSLIDRECLQCRVVAVRDIKKEKRLQYRGELSKEGIAALLSLPLTVRGRAIGVLRIYSSTPYTFSESDIEFLSALSCQGAIAIENARLFEHVRNEYKELAQDVWKWYDWGERFPKL